MLDTLMEPIETLLRVLTKLKDLGCLEEDAMLVEGPKVHLVSSISA